MRLGTVASATLAVAGAAAAVTLTDDGDGTNGFPVDYWLPGTWPAVGDRVIYERLGRQIVVHHHVGATYERHVSFSKIVATGTTVALTAVTGVSFISDNGVTGFTSGVFTAPAGDFYSATLHADNLGDNTTRSFLIVRANGATVARDSTGSANGASAYAMTANAELWLNTNDTLDFALFQNTGANLTVTGYVSVVRGR